MVVEQIVELDEEMMMRYLEGESIGPEELRKTAHDAIAQGKLVPVLCVCTRKTSACASYWIWFPLADFPPPISTATAPEHRGRCAGRGDPAG